MSLQGKRSVPSPGCHYHVVTDIVLNVVSVPRFLNHGPTGTAVRPLTRIRSDNLPRKIACLAATGVQTTENETGGQFTGKRTSPVREAGLYVQLPRTSAFICSAAVASTENRRKGSDPKANPPVGLPTKSQSTVM
jgi:hypothetical protein